MKIVLSPTRLPRWNVKSRMMTHLEVIILTIISNTHKYIEHRREENDRISNNLENEPHFFHYTIISPLKVDLSTLIHLVAHAYYKHRRH